MDPQTQQSVHGIVFAGNAVEMPADPFHLFLLGNCKISEMGHLFGIGDVCSRHFETAGILGRIVSKVDGKTRDDQTGFTTTPERMHRVQARTRLTLPSWRTCRTCCRLGYQIRLVLLFAWLTLLPT
jgi:uncharacterized protein (UPF0218 family)